MKVAAEQLNERGAGKLPGHLGIVTGRTTQVWAATVLHRETGRTIALFRCTQLLVYPK